MITCPHCFQADSISCGSRGAPDSKHVIFTVNGTFILANAALVRYDGLREFLGTIWGHFIF